nr:hypothetical protein CFP56_66715 [Quercus suber]
MENWKRALLHVEYGVYVRVDALVAVDWLKSQCFECFYFVWVTRTRTRTLELLLYYLSRLRLSVHRFFLEAARVLEVARIRCFLVS